MNTSEKLILSFLRENNQVDLMKRFHQVISMSRSRQDAKQEINAKSIPIFLHLIPYAVMKEMKLVVPKTWVSEINNYLDNIDIKNSGKTKTWFSATQVFEIIDSFLDRKVEDLVFKKLSGYSSFSKIKPEIKKFFSREPLSLKNLNISLKHVPSDYGKKLMFFINDKELK